MFNVVLLVPLAQEPETTALHVSALLRPLCSISTSITVQEIPNYAITLINASVIAQEGTITIHPLVSVIVAKAKMISIVTTVFMQEASSLVHFLAKMILFFSRKTNPASL